jgi:hypothetical protein
LSAAKWVLFKPPKVLKAYVGNVDRILLIMAEYAHTVTELIDNKIRFTSTLPTPHPTAAVRGEADVSSLFRCFSFTEVYFDTLDKV